MRFVAWAGFLKIFLSGSFVNPATAATALPTYQTSACELVDVPADWARENPVDCGWVSVPTHRGKSDGVTLKLWVFRIKANGGPPEREARAVIRMVGGLLPRFPNIATLDGFSTRLLRRTHDVIFFDYRGVGKSEPTVACKVAQVSGVSAAERLDSKVAQYRACRRQIDGGGADLTAINSRDNGLDVADIARAMGYRRYAIRAESYANLPAFDLIRSRPVGLEAAVIGLVSPPNSLMNDFIAAFGDGMVRWQHACDLQPACKARFPDLAGTLTKAFDRFEREPLIAAGRRVTPADLASAIFDLGFDTETLPFVPIAIDAAATGEARLLSKWFSLLPPSDFTMPDMTEPLSPIYATLICSEDDKGFGHRPLLEKSAAQYPYLARAAKPSFAIDRLCSAWRKNLPPADLFAAPSGEIPILLTSAGLDPSRSPADGLLTARTLPHATFIELPGISHLNKRSDCQYAMEAAFLAAPAQPVNQGCTLAMKNPVFALDGFDTFLDTLR